MSWQEQGACWGSHSPIFFVDVKGVPGQRTAAKAKAICAACPVRVECLDFAITEGMHWGIWGGLAPRERRAVKMKRRTAA